MEVPRNFIIKSADERHSSRKTVSSSLPNADHGFRASLDKVQMPPVQAIKAVSAPIIGRLPVLQFHVYLKGRYKGG